MRLSQFMKEAPPSAPPQVVEPPKIKAPSSVSPPFVSPSQSETLEKDIRELLEKEFQIKLQFLEKELKHNFDQRLAEENQRFQEREDALAKEKQEMLQQIEESAKKNEALIRQREQTFETELTRRIESERERFRLEAERLKNEIRQKEEELRTKDKLFAEEMSRCLENEKSKMEEKIHETREADAQKKETAAPQPQEKKEPSFTDQPPVVIRPEVEGPSFLPVEKPPSPVPPPAEQKIELPDEETLKKVREIYAELIAAGQSTFDQVTRQQPIELSRLQMSLRRMVEFVLKKDVEMAEVVLEEYPDSNYFSYHAANCAILSVLLGLDFKLSQEQLEELALASFLHDVGLAGIRESLDYPKQLTPELQNEVLKHPERGAKILENVVSELIVNAILQHHETANGQGYPEGLTEEKIHLYARLIQVADSFEAMTHSRPYRQHPLPVHEAVKEMIAKGRGIYDREVLKALMGRIGLYPVMSLVELSNKQIGRVIRQNPRFPMSPIVCVEFDEDGNKLKQSLILDLTKNQLVHITASLKAVPSYGKARIEHEQIKSEKKQHAVLAVREYMPFILIIAILALLVYIVLKI